MSKRDIHAFIKEDKPGFHIGYIDHPTAVAEDIVSLVGDTPHIIVHSVSSGVYGLSALVKAIYHNVDKETLSMLGGVVGTVVKSLYPHAKVPYEAYKDIHGPGVWHTIAKLMDKVAQKKNAQKLIWIIDEFPMYEKNNLWLLLQALSKISSPASHKIIVLSYRPHMPYATKISCNLPHEKTPMPKGKAGKALRILSLLSYASYGFLRRYIAYKIVTHMGLDKGYIKLRDMGIVLETDGYINTKDKSLWREAIDKASGEEIDSTIRFILEEKTPARLFTAAYLYSLKGENHSALRHIREYAIYMKHEGMPMEGQLNMEPLLEALKEHISREDLEALVDLAASSGHISPLVKEAINTLISDTETSPQALLAIAYMSEHLDERERSHLIHTIKAKLEHATPLEETLLGYALLSTYYHMDRIPLHFVQEAFLHIRTDDIEPTDLKIMTLVIRSRTYLLHHKHTHAIKDLMDGIKLSVDSGIHFYMGILYNNLVYTLKQLGVNDDFKLTPFVKKSFELSFLYESNDVGTIALQNYVTLASEAGSRYEYLILMLRDMYDIVGNILTPDNKSRLLLASAAVELEYGYIDKAEGMLNMVGDILERHKDITWRIWSIYFILRYRLNKYRQKPDRARYYLELFKESVGTGENIEILYKVIESIKNPTSICTEDSFAAYVSSIKLGKPEEGIKVLRSHLWEDLRGGKLLSAAYDEMYIALLYKLIGNQFIAKKHIFISAVLGEYLGMAQACSLMEGAGIKDVPQSPPLDTILLTLLDRHAGFIISKITEATTLEDFLENVLQYIPIPAFSLWIDFTIGGKRYYKEYTLISDIFPGFFKEPRSIHKMLDSSGISQNPSYIYVKLKEGNKTLVIYAQNMLATGVFEERHFMPLSIWAENILMKASELSESGKILMDEETGLYSQWYIRHRLSKEFERAKRERKPLSVIVVGFDRQTYLSNMWQEDIMKALGEVVGSSIREIDIAGKIGKEEILIILPGTPGHEARLVAKRIIEKARTLRKLGITVHTGIDSIDYPPRYKRYDSLLSGGTLALRKAISSGEEIFAYKDLSL